MLIDWLGDGEGVVAVVEQTRHIMFTWLDINDLTFTQSVTY